RIYVLFRRRRSDLLEAPPFFASKHRARRGCRSPSHRGRAAVPPRLFCRPCGELRFRICQVGSWKSPAWRVSPFQFACLRPAPFPDSGSLRLPRSRESRYHFLRRTVPPTIRISYPITHMSMLAPCPQKRAPHGLSLSNKPPHPADFVSLSSNAAVDLSAQARRRDTRHSYGLATARSASAAAPTPIASPFNSAQFIFVFLPIVLSVFFLLGRLREQMLAVMWLVIASLVFYSSDDPYRLLPLILSSIAFNFFIGRMVLRSQSR